MEETAGCARRAKTQAMYGSSAAAYWSGTRRVRWGRPSGEGGREIAGGSGGCSFVGGCPSNPAGILGSPKSDVGSAGIRPRVRFWAPVYVLSGAS